MTGKHFIQIKHNTYAQLMNLKVKTGLRGLNAVIEELLKAVEVNDNELDRHIPTKKNGVD